ncbi:MAG: prepilin-type N-terminal cleavage/methylation domain-containing protein [Gammaproteobacteria bacterium]|jgi:MSHA biogenesis protein MshO|nr:prepilin-type N-terminal cleavage/methylation domain-containing protein [Gammaproteobacteria bacterium]MBT7306754.1 prepilin-type N-terminal cleavage/methylation domain-containing protein [Gammaproteobacteria bacterium]
MRSPQCSESGFTLFEVILVLMLMGIVVTISGLMLLQAYQANDAVRNGWDTLGKSRYASERMLRELRSVRRNPADLTAYEVTTWSASSFAFTRTDSTTVSIDYSDPSDKIEISYPSLLATPQLLADQVTSFSFSYLQINHADAATTLNNLAYVVIDITLSDGGVIYQQQSEVNLRNRMGWN